MATVAVLVTRTLSLVSVAVYVMDSAVVSLQSKVIWPLPFVVVIRVGWEACEGSPGRRRSVRRAGDDCERR